MIRYRHFARVVVAAAAVSCLPSVASATPILFGVTFGNQLISINPATGAGALVGNLSSAMAAFGLGNTGGNLYAFDQQADLLRQLNPANGATVASIDLGLGNLTGEGAIDFRSDGVGFLGTSSGSTGTLDRFTTSPGSGVTVGTQNTAGIDGLAFNSLDTLYALGQGAGVPNTSALYIANQTTGALTLVGPTGVLASILGGLTFDLSGAILYAAINDNLYTLNTATGAATLVGGIGFAQVSGLTFLDVTPTSAVPEPASLLLVGSGIALVARRRRAKQK